ncbi:hypothetical protein WMY93_022904 [Mugilogobius chulae]|uniref:Uncharacterized protein n=1 Tax=Mugilogobius chulae TaxID=88201 RepID=A0AAW0N5Y1_9GOBI
MEEHAKLPKQRSPEAHFSKVTHAGKKSISLSLDELGVCALCRLFFSKEREGRARFPHTHAREIRKKTAAITAWGVLRWGKVLIADRASAAVQKREFVPVVQLRRADNVHLFLLKQGRCKERREEMDGL